MSKLGERQKASDVFRDANFVFAQKVSFSQAFPDVEDITVEVEETGDGVEWGGHRTLGKNAVGEYIDCSNPLCYNGGVQIGSILREMVRNKQTVSENLKICQGYEGSPKGKRKYRDCMNFFKIRVSIKYKDSPAPAATKGQDSTAA